MTTKVTRPRFEEKCWGKVLHIFESDHAAVSLLELIEGWQCSRHYHRFRANQFAVQEGCVCIEEWPIGSVDPIRTLLFPGQVHTVLPQRIHRFLVIESGKMVEVYWPCGGLVKSNDIVREDVGGHFDLQEYKAMLREGGSWTTP